MSDHNLEPYFTNLVASLSWDADIGCVYLQWTGNPNDDQYKAVLNAGLDLLTEKSAATWLSDGRLITVARPLAPDWAKSDWIPRAQAAGMKQLVMVLPKDAWAQTVATTGVRALFDVFDPQYFPSVDEARKWISEQG